GGGLELLQVTDNGCGIRREDLPLLCRKHATSKLHSADELVSLRTFGFRGEALASMSVTGHVTVTTRASDVPASQPAYKARYLMGELAPLRPGDEAAAPKPAAVRVRVRVRACACACV